MKVNKNSWHYRLLTGDIFGIQGVNSWNVSSSLCLYFWQVVFMLLWKGVALIFLTPFVINSLLILPLVSTLGLITTGVIVQGDTGLTVLVMELIVIIVFVIVLAGLSLYTFLKDKTDLADVVEKDPNLFVEYIKAKKNKLCPIIEFVEGE